MMEVILSAAMSIDGRIDDASPARLRLSSPEDWDEVLALRARCDAILVGAGTVRRDDPSLVIRDPDLRRRRVCEGMDPDIIKVTATRSGWLDASAAFFTAGEGRKIVFAPLSADDAALHALETYAEVVRAGDINARFICDTLAARGVHRLMVEGGSGMLTMFLAEGVADRLRLSVAPFMVGDAGAPRLVGDGPFHWNSGNRMTLEGVAMLGDTAVLNYTMRR